MAQNLVEMAISAGYGEHTGLQGAPIGREEDASAGHGELTAVDLLTGPMHNRVGRAEGFDLPRVLAYIRSLELARTDDGGVLLGAPRVVGGRGVAGREREGGWGISLREGSKVAIVAGESKII